MLFFILLTLQEENYSSIITMKKIWIILLVYGEYSELFIMPITMDHIVRMSPKH